MKNVDYNLPNVKKTITDPQKTTKRVNHILTHISDTNQRSLPMLEAAFSGVSSKEFFKTQTTDRRTFFLIADLVSKND